MIEEKSRGVIRRALNTACNDIKVALKYWQCEMKKGVFKYFFKKGKKISWHCKDVGDQRESLKNGYSKNGNNHCPKELYF